MQPNYDIRIFEKYAELLDRHLEANESYVYSSKSIQKRKTTMF